MIRSFVTPAIFLLLTIFLAPPSAAQELSLPAPSPLAKVMQTAGITEITVTYSSPGKKDREIFGGLVPFDELWRTGANAATTIELSHDVMMAGKAVPAGLYSIFSIPGKDSWTVIINKNADQSGTRSYDEALDQARFMAKPMASPTVRERMTFLFENTKSDSTTLVLDWAGTHVALPITIDTSALAAAGIDTYVDSAAGRLARSARYLLENDGDLDQAGMLADAAVAANLSWFNLWIQASVLYAQGDNKSALKLAKQAWELGEQAENFFYRERIEAALTDWKKKKK